MAERPQPPCRRLLTAPTLLGNVFTRLGLTSRTQLAARISANRAGTAEAGSRAR